MRLSAISAMLGVYSIDVITRQGHDPQPLTDAFEELARNLDIGNASDPYTVRAYRLALIRLIWHTTQNVKDLGAKTALLDGENLPVQAVLKYAFRRGFVLTEEDVLKARALADKLVAGDPIDEQDRVRTTKGELADFVKFCNYPDNAAPVSTVDLARAAIVAMSDFGVDDPETRWISLSQPLLDHTTF